MADELIDILTAQGAPTGEIKLKSEAHKKGLWHASAHIWLYTPQGKVLIQKRAPNKDTYPNMWDISVAGHLSAKDTPISGALREIEEEIGLIISAEALQFLKTIKKSCKPSPNIIDNEFNHIFISCHLIDIDKLKLQVEEVSKVRLIPITNFENELKNNYSQFVPHGITYYSYVIRTIKNTLNLK